MASANLYCLHTLHTGCNTYTSVCIYYIIMTKMLCYSRFVAVHVYSFHSPVSVPYMHAHCPTHACTLSHTCMHTVPHACTPHMHTCIYSLHAPCTHTQAWKSSLRGPSTILSSAALKCLSSTRWRSLRRDWQWEHLWHSPDWRNSSSI